MQTRGEFSSLFQAQAIIYCWEPKSSNLWNPGCLPALYSSKNFLVISARAKVGYLGLLGTARAQPRTFFSPLRRNTWVTVMVKKIRWNGIHLLYRFVCFVFCSGSCDILRGIFLSYNSLYIHVHMTSVKFKRHSSLKVTSPVLKWENKQT